ncbi:phosphate transport system regulatory protein PhoU [Mycolicibacterium agri]|uniref:Phosphate-specific transport system accessory protein PhoU n=1 Tax=Mycolicibacterium agri TaxID=36811 RepID=A0A2A7MPZ4_MYCAG|nr:phosphate signaling complex protein PhoU [Mycolicibacterium agri]PEG33610.1 phosphate transport system regulatory protein PhoU [Mycolicibacterium agri]GFG51914.1 phosphate transport system regulatory protein PhoU [Mycolicibacterium agri]
MRTAYHQELSRLGAQLGEMCGLAADAMEHATTALLEADLTLAEQVIADHDQLKTLSQRSESSALRLLALQAPVAGDLRKIVGSIHVSADIERMGALAVHVASISRLRHPDCALPDEVRASFAEMGSRAVKLARTAQEVLISNDSGKASRLETEDDAVDAEHRHLFTLLIDRNWQDGVCSAVDVALLGRYYERFADHAVEIGRRVVFEATGGLPTHKQLA